MITSWLLPVFISMTLDGVMSFSCVKNLRNACKSLCYNKSSWRNFFSCYGGKLNHLKDTLALSSFLVCLCASRS